MGINWFAVVVRPRHEKTVARTLRAKGYEEILPLYSCLRRWSDRVKRVTEPLFSRYVFCRFDPLRRLDILITPGVVSIVGSSKGPIAVEESEVASLQGIMKSGLAAEPWPFLRVGQAVRIIAGPLSGIDGILAESKNGHRLVVSVTLLQRSVAVEVDHLWVTPVSSVWRPGAHKQPGVQDLDRYPVRREVFSSTPRSLPGPMEGRPVVGFKRLVG